MNKIQIISTAASVLFLALIVQLTRKKKIRTQYSLVWFGCGLVLLVFSVFKSLLDSLAHILGIFAGPNLVIIILVFLGLILGIHFSIVISHISEENRRLIQEVGLLKARLEELRPQKPGAEK